MLFQLLTENFYFGSGSLCFIYLAVVHATVPHLYVVDVKIGHLETNVVIYQCR